MTDDARVACFSGHTYAQRPVAFVWGEKYLKVSDIHAEWHTPEGKRFLITAEDEWLFELSYVASEDRWHIEKHG